MNLRPEAPLRLYSTSQSRAQKSGCAKRQVYDCMSTCASLSWVHRSRKSSNSFCRSLRIRDINTVCIIVGNERCLASVYVCRSGSITGASTRPISVMSCRYQRIRQHFYQNSFDTISAVKLKGQKVIHNTHKDKAHLWPQRCAVV